MTRRLAVFVLLLAAAPAAADILPPDSKWVNHVARFEGLDKHADYVFYVYPRDLNRNRPGNSSIRVPSNGEVAISGVNPIALRDGLYLFAVPRSIHGKDDRMPEESWFEGKTDGVLKSPRLVRPIRALPRSDKRSRIVTRYQVEIKDGLKLKEVMDEEPKEKPTSVEDEGTETVEAQPKRWPWIMGGSFGGMALVCAVWLAARKKV